MVNLDDLIVTNEQGFHRHCNEPGCKGTDAKIRKSYKFEREIMIDLGRFYGEASTSNPQDRNFTYRSFPILIPMGQIRIAAHQYFVHTIICFVELPPKPDGKRVGTHVVYQREDFRGQWYEVQNGQKMTVPGMGPAAYVSKACGCVFCPQLTDNL